MIDLDKFMPFILPYVEDAPIPLAEQAVLRASIEFCEETKYWRHELECISLIKSIKSYDLYLPDDSQVSSIEEPVEVGGLEVYLKTKHWLGNNIANWATITGKVAYIYIPSQGTIRVVPIPDGDDITGMSISVILKPKPTSKTLPDFLFNEHFECIAEGAKAILYKIPNKKWTDLNLHMDSRAVFSQAMAKAEAKSKSGYKTEDRQARVKPSHF